MNKKCKDANGSFEFIKGDISDKKLIMDIFKKYKPDIVVKRKSNYKNGKYVSMIIMAILREDYERMPSLRSENDE